jgi:hypothetical protein
LDLKFTLSSEEQHLGHMDIWFVHGSGSSSIIVLESCPFLKKKSTVIGQVFFPKNLDHGDESGTIIFWGTAHKITCVRRFDRMNSETIAI